MAVHVRFGLLGAGLEATGASEIAQPRLGKPKRRYFLSRLSVKLRTPRKRLDRVPPRYSVVPVLVRGSSRSWGVVEPTECAKKGTKGAFLALFIPSVLTITQFCRHLVASSTNPLDRSQSLIEISERVMIVFQLDQIGVTSWTDGRSVGCEGTKSEVRVSYRSFFWIFCLLPFFIANSVYQIYPFAE